MWWLRLCSGAKKNYSNFDLFIYHQPPRRYVSRCFSLSVNNQAKMKADRSRLKMAESLQKATHTQRSEAAQARREEKRRAEKDKMMAEDDPDKQRKLEVGGNTGCWHCSFLKLIESETLAEFVYIWLDLPKIYRSTMYIYGWICLRSTVVCLRSTVVL